MRWVIIVFSLISANPRRSAHPQADNMRSQPEAVPQRTAPSTSRPQDEDDLPGPSVRKPSPPAMTGRDEDSDDDIGPIPPANGAGEKRKAENGLNGEAEDSDDDDFEEEPAAGEAGEADMLPVSHEIILKDHTKVSQIIFPPPSMFLCTDKAT